MTNKQLTSADIDRVENLSYTPLEKAYLKVLMVKTIFSYLLLMGLALFLLLAENFSGRYTAIVCIEAYCWWHSLSIFSFCRRLLPKRALLSASMTLPTGRACFFLQ